MALHFGGPRRSVGFLRLLLPVLVFCVFVSAVAHATCGCASCPIDTKTTDELTAGSVRFDYSFEYIDQRTPRTGRERADVGQIPGDHAEIYTVNRTHRLGIDVGVTPRFSVQTVFPWVSRSHQHVHTDENELQTWDFSGFGDATLLTRYAFYRPAQRSKPTLASLIGGKIPIGRRHATNEDGEEAEVGIQPGSGAWSLMLGASSVQNFSIRSIGGRYVTMPFFVSTLYQWNGEGTHDYKLGNQWLTNVGTTYPVTPKIGLMAQLNLRVVGHDSPGETDEQTDRTGGTYLYFSPGLQVTLSGGLSSYMYVQLPLYQRVNVIQLTSNYNLMAGFSYRFLKK